MLISHISRHLIFAILRKFCILTHFNFAFLSETQFISLSMLFYMSLKIWSNNLINNVQINRNAADYVNSNKKDVLTASRRHGMYLPMLECKSRYYWSIDLNIHYIKYSFLLTPGKKCCRLVARLMLFNRLRKCLDTDQQGGRTSFPFKTSFIPAFPHPFKT